MKMLRHLALTARTVSALALSALALSSVVAMNAPAAAQPAKPKWRPGVESIIVRASAPKNYMNALTASHLGSAFVVSASIPVPYSDLDLAREADASEMDRRVHLAADLVCQQLDKRYPPTQYPLLEGYSGAECARQAAMDGMEHVEMIVASAKH